METHVGPFWSALERYGDMPALTGEGVTLSYAALAHAADDWAARARTCLPRAVTRPLVALELGRSLPAITAYLGCLRAGWPVILLAEGEARPDHAIRATYAPNLIVTGPMAHPAAGDPGPAAFCDDLAVLLSTSGTTGASKLVKLSGANLQANAASIIEYLGIRPDDRTITTLPLHYSYGMSVLHTHLSVGARLAVTEAPLTDPSFWALARAQSITSLALVPTQFDLLEKVGLDTATLPHLRTITQAGGRLDPATAQRFARRAQAEGWQLFLMYGQTEAAPRMAYLPPALALSHSDTIGKPIPGGRLWIMGEDGQEITTPGQPGELLYQGPNVMIGYALARADLATARKTDILHTGDVAQRTPEGLFQIVGRRSRFVKLNGLRIGLDEVEATLRREGHRLRVAGDDRGLVLFTETDTGTLARDTAARYGLLRDMVRAQHLPAPPLLPSGKVDYAELHRRADRILSTDPEPEPAPTSPTAAGDLIATLQGILALPDIDPARSFRDLGGGSLAYLEVELHLMKTRGTVPEGWDRLPLRDLARPPAADRPADRLADRLRWQTIGSDVVIRVIAIFWVILLHTTDLVTGGGVFALTILMGYSLARHQVHALTEGRVLRTLDAMLRPLLLAYFTILALLALRVEVDWQWIALVANLPAAFGPAPPASLLEPYWFVAAYAQSILLICLAFTLSPVRRWVAASAFRAGSLVTAALTAVIAVAPFGDLDAAMIRLPLGMIQLAALGWCAAFADTRARKLIVIALATASCLVDWHESGLSVQEAILIPTILLVVIPRLRLPGLLARAFLELGKLSLYIYLLHVPAIYIDYHFVQTTTGLFLSTAVVSTVGAIIARSLLRRLDRRVAPVLQRWLSGTQGARPSHAPEERLPDDA
ncbi:AMP-binding protein [Paragemmobacter ruber]|uniref:AMP-binding protein n=1 Tax=Paragemmobacter ruber TaxID=1985673 RepID=A0ABW9Y6L8_9RHOB|nr:AMP-binding protein [Rhodobacter ruber]NBE08043.1 AMP-binding protein [Rhodobacter ruber]